MSELIWPFVLGMAAGGIGASFALLDCRPPGGAMRLKSGRASSRGVRR